MWELIQITSQLGIKDSHAVHTVTHCRHSFAETVEIMESGAFSCCWAKQRNLGTWNHPRTASGHFCQRCAGPRKGHNAAGKKARDFCQCKSVLKATKVPQPGVPVAPGALCSLGSLSSPFWASQEIPVVIHVIIQSSTSTTVPNSYQANISTQETFGEMENKQPIKTKLD